MLKRSWVEIDLNVLKNNWKILRQEVPPDRRIMAVVKADAYGHGACEIAQVLQELGCTDFAVSNPEEALALREAGITGQILVLGWTPPEYVGLLCKAGITQALLSEEYALSLSGKGLKAQFALDTGMNRIGLDAEDPEACERVIRRFASSFELTGLFTHLCAADTPEQDAFTRLQIERFRAVAERVKDLGLKDLHCMNSAGALRFPPYGDLMRLGIVLYGLRPDPSVELPAGIRPVLAWKSVISMIKTVHAGETIGYGRAFRAEHEIRVATIPTGYADGYNRLLSGTGIVLLRGERLPVLGRVCMDQMMVDVTGVPDAVTGEVVTLLGGGYSAEDMADMIGTIGYEVVCGIGKRVPRVFMHK